jgi:hypothetical protein
VENEVALTVSSSLWSALENLIFDRRFFFSGELTLLCSDVDVLTDFVEISLDDELVACFFFRVARFVRGLLIEFLAHFLD